MYAIRSYYETVYAKQTGSAAAPTAGLHFTEDLLSKIIAKGVKIIKVTLHVGLGTFRPVKVENVLEHKMHSEYYHVSQDAAEAINQTKQAGGNIICTGTTSVRTLETVTDSNGVVQPRITSYNVCYTKLLRFGHNKSMV